MKILLMGNPNVGKSVLFSRLTGIHVMASNYPGTTVGYTRGFMKVGDEKAEVIDVPGTYTLEPTTEAETVALSMLETGDVVIVEPGEDHHTTSSDDEPLVAAWYLMAKEQG